MSYDLGTDLRLRFSSDGDADLDVAPGDLDLITGRPNLGQALRMRLLVRKGELAALGHPDFGSRIGELIGRPMDRPNISLLERFAARAVEADPRVSKVLNVAARLRPGQPGILDLLIDVLPVDGEPTRVEASVDVG